MQLFSSPQVTQGVKGDSILLRQKFKTDISAFLVQEDLSQNVQREPCLYQIK